MTQTVLFEMADLPVFGFLSAETRQALNAYVAQGNSAFRAKKLLEFFRTLDWLQTGLDLDDLMAEGPVSRLSLVQRRQLRREIMAYLASKAESREKSAEKREQYRLRIFEYFRARVPRADKVLLESLRDYELDQTGRDVNWRHHFTLDSFRKIDGFVNAGVDERAQRIAAFRKDVETYRKNYEKLHQQARCDHTFTFDDWCNMLGDENPRQWKRTQSAKTTGATSPLSQAYRMLEVSPAASDDEIKRQFRRLTLLHHPDMPTGSEEKMKALLAAYETVTRTRQFG